MPVRHSGSPYDDSLRPIDVLYGHYEPKTREIEIFVKRIDKDANIFDTEPGELREIVRIHEHAHAVVHLGSRADDVYDYLEISGQNKRTEWSEFIDRQQEKLVKSYRRTLAFFWNLTCRNEMKPGNL
jgi:hypothetical protein